MVVLKDVLLGVGNIQLAAAPLTKSNCGEVIMSPQLFLTPNLCRCVCECVGMWSRSSGLPDPFGNQASFIQAGVETSRGRGGLWVGGSLMLPGALGVHLVRQKRVAAAAQALPRRKASKLGRHHMLQWLAKKSLKQHFSQSSARWPFAFPLRLFAFCSLVGHTLSLALTAHHTKTKIPRAGVGTVSTHHLPPRCLNKAPSCFLPLTLTNPFSSTSAAGEKKAETNTGKQRVGCT